LKSVNNCARLPLLSLRPIKSDRLLDALQADDPEPAAGERWLITLQDALRGRFQHLLEDDVEPRRRASDARSDQGMAVTESQRPISAGRAAPQA